MLHACMPGRKAKQLPQRAPPLFEKDPGRASDKHTGQKETARTLFARRLSFCCCVEHRGADEGHIARWHHLSAEPTLRFDGRWPRFIRPGPLRSSMAACGALTTWVWSARAPESELGMSGRSPISSAVYATAASEEATSCLSKPAA